MICEKCGRTIPEEAVFCSYCGSRNMRKVCKACGTELQKDQKFCHVCGLKCDGKAPQPEEQKKDEQKKDEQKKKKRILREESLSEKDSLSGKRKTVYYILYIAFGVIYAALTGIMVILGIFGYYEYHSYLYETGIRHAMIDVPVFWLGVVSVIAGIVQHVYIFLKDRKGKKIQKVNRIASVILMLNVIFWIIIFLIIFVGNNSVHIRILI